jgi:hypothetical protein
VNKWVGHRLVEFGSDVCQNCGNERLRHLHRIQTDEGIIEVGCVCASKLCADQDEEIKSAERLMNKQDVKLKLIAALKESWKITRSKGAVRKVIGQYNGHEVLIYWELGCGWTTKLPDAPVCPEPRGWERVQTFIEDYYMR